MSTPKQNILDDYPIGTVIKLIKMNDIVSLPSGTRGKIAGIDSLGSLIVRWENGSTLKLIPEMDTFIKI